MKKHGRKERRWEAGGLYAAAGPAAGSAKKGEGRRGNAAAGAEREPVVDYLAAAEAWEKVKIKVIRGYPEE